MWLRRRVDGTVLVLSEASMVSAVIYLHLLKVLPRIDEGAGDSGDKVGERTEVIHPAKHEIVSMQLAYHAV